MDGRGNHGESVAIIGMACRFPGARNPAEFHDLAVAGRRMFSPAATLPGRALRAAMLDDRTVPQVAAGDSLLGEIEPEPPDRGPAQKLAAEMTALALTDLRPFLSAAGPTVSEGTLASRPVVACVPRMRCAEDAGPSGPTPPGRCAAPGRETRAVR